LDAHNAFIFNIEEFYSLQKRQLPWRKDNPDPYEVWLSEVIMQQTRIAQGTPYFTKIVKRYPTIEALAKAEEDELLGLWTGLGYYSRARNLLAGAQQIALEFKGKMPQRSKDLLSIKGIGPYTAAAIASICFGERKGVVDGNVYRVLSRYFGIQTAINATAGIKEFQSLADHLIGYAQHPGNYNQGLMEFGALQCVPKNPDCTHCPMKDHCTAFNTNSVSKLPVKIKKGTRSLEVIHFAVVQRDEQFAFQKRATKGIWGGLHEFPRLANEPVGGLLLKGPIVHKLSHKDLLCHFWQAEESQVTEDFTYYSKSKIKEMGMPIIIADFVNNTK
jgi:A/G-specific adenine glycosylase